MSLVFKPQLSSTLLFAVNGSEDMALFPNNHVVISSVSTVSNIPHRELFTMISVALCVNNKHELSVAPLLACHNVHSPHIFLLVSSIPS